MRRGILALLVCSLVAIGCASIGSANADPMRTNDAYAAMGDSVAAGDGLPLAGTGVVATACGRSTQAYPYAVASSLNMALNDVACSGATTDKGVFGPQQISSTTTLPSQVDQAFAVNNPRLVTVTIGANDVNWQQLITQCYTTGCGTTQDNQQFEASLLQLRAKLAVTLGDIRLHQGWTPNQVLVTGYYSPVSTAQPQCSDTQGLTNTEITWINSKEQELNNVIRESVAVFPSAHYVPLNFTGHELCSSDPWVQGVQAAAPFHPTAAGQAAIATAVLDAAKAYHV